MRDFAFDAFLVADRYICPFTLLCDALCSVVRFLRGRTMTLSTGRGSGGKIAFLAPARTPSRFFKPSRVHILHPAYDTKRHRRAFRARAGSETDEETSVEKDSDLAEEEEQEDPIWVRREKMREIQKTEATGKLELPFFVSLPLAAVTAIAAIGSCFEIANKNPVFGVIPPESPLWLPILAFFALTGLPVSGYFFFSSVKAANKLADQMDKVDKA